MGRATTDEELGASEARFRVFFDHAADGFFLLDDRLTVVDVNRQACASLGYGREELIGRHPRDFDAGLDDTAMAGLSARVAAGETLTFESVHRRKDGSEFPVEIRVVQFQDGERRYFFCIARDVTARNRAEERISQQDAEMRQILDLTPVLVAMFAHDRKRLYANRATLDYLGLTLEQWRAISDPLWFFHPDDAERMARDVYAKPPDDGPQEVEAQMRKSDGSYRWFLIRDNALRDEQGRVTRRYLSGIDIEDRKRAEDALARSEACLAEAQRLTKTGSWILDPSGRRSNYWSAEMFRIWGFDPAKGIPEAQTAFTRLHPDDYDQSRKHFERALALALQCRARAPGSSAQDAGTDVDVVDACLVMPDGTLKYIRSVARAVLDDAGQLVEYLGAHVDITGQKRADEALRASEARFRMFVDHATDAFFLRDRSARKLIDVNRRACESLGYTREELIGMRPEDFDPNVHARFAQWLDEQLKTGEIVAFESRHRRKDGTTFPVEVHARAFAQGDRRFVLSLARDTSDRKRAEAERERLRELEAELAHINRVSMVGEMVASIAHEISQPLAALIGYGGACVRWLAGNAPQMEKARESADCIVREAERAGEIVERVRALVKKVPAPRAKLDLNDTVREVLALVVEEAKRRGVVIRTDFAQDLAPVLGDRVQVQQVVLNIVMNAMDAMSETAVRRLLVSTRNDDAGQVRVAVRDTGKGLDPITMERMFEAFYSTKPGGMGMGLSISRSIVQSHAGRMWAAPNDDGPGAAVQFTVPRYVEGQSAAAD